MKDELLYLVHIHECIQKVRRYTVGGYEAFLNDEMQQDAVVRNLQILAESTQRLSEPLKAEYPEVRWQLVAGFRNVVVHQYLDLKIERIWAVVEGHRDILDDAVQRAMVEHTKQTATEQEEGIA